ncbi:MAG: type II toxin-antitoxin system mRNA interferase toxin, RelE/StbE family [bacterium]|nr:type II toxin-antitoxin system mRNA interferase toxin, RelE/StbE family [Candidatus Microgenomates bacterium CPR3]MCQ3944805.1 type II toxin-antitoxin system mRNA interferase toxin, RelE/StbE family [bacterium]
MVQVFLTDQAIKDFKKISVVNQKKIKKRLSLLEKDNLAGKKLTGKLSELYSLRAWPYRILYVIQNKEVWVTHIAHRQGVYK